MKTRVISAAVLIVIVAACFVIGPLTRLLLLLAAAFLATWEMSRALKSEDSKHPVWVLYAFLAATSVLCYFGANEKYLSAAVLLAVFAVLSCGVISQDIGGRGALATLSVLAYPILPFLFLMWLSVSERTYIPVFLIGCISTWLCDAFALFGGKRFGKHKLNEAVSPNKTVEGSVCGALASVVGGVILFFCLKKGFHISFFPCILTALISSSFGQMGDLAASLIKRMTGIKDYSNLIPGHGGIMDRLDSLLFAVPTAYFCLSLMSAI